MLAIATATITKAQEALKARVSPLEMATLNYEGTYIKVTYGRPHKNEREIFGALVPYGEVWRTGANEATEITITDDVIMGGKRIKAGTYTLFTIPEEHKWTVILNNQLGQWGAYNYNRDKDVYRFSVPSSPTEVVYEPFTIEFELVNDKINLLMMWDKTKIAIPIQIP